MNNAVFSTLYETGRVAVLADPARGLADAGCSFVIARISIDFLGEIFWPGTVEIGTAVQRVGTSSATFVQALFQNGALVSKAESVVVHVDGKTHRSTPISAAGRAALAALAVKAV